MSSFHCGWGIKELERKPFGTIARDLIHIITVETAGLFEMLCQLSQKRMCRIGGGIIDTIPSFFFATILFVVDQLDYNILGL